MRAERRIIALLVPGAILLAAFILRAINLGHPAGLAFDEIFFIPASRIFLWNGSFTRNGWQHPPMFLIISWLSLIFGNKLIAYRLLMVVLGTALVGIEYLMAKIIFKSRRTAAIAAAIIAVEPLCIGLSRISFIEMAAVVLMSAGLTFLFKAMEDGEETLIVPSAILLAMAAATKWYGIPVLAIAMFIWLRERLRLTGDAARVTTVFNAVLAFVILPVVIYFAAYTPWTRSGHSLTEVLAMQRSMYRWLSSFHPSQILALSSPGSSAIGWLTSWRIVLVEHYILPGHASLKIALLTLNPVFWWGSWAVFMARSLRIRRWETGSSGRYVLLLIAGQFLPLLVLSRNLYIYSALPLMPWLAMLLADWLTGRWESGGKAQAVGLSVALVSVSAYIYPLVVGLVVPYAAYSSLLDYFRPG